MAKLLLVVFAYASIHLYNLQKVREVVHHYCNGQEHKEDVNLIVYVYPQVSPTNTAVPFYQHDINSFLVVEWLI